ncbi:hypothetical protein ACFQU1_14190 [Chelatococcus sp. GCM10030263]|uniref:hypothetical protein n=1 Tax=Chelatococcus sp. GCM10030263 TaxID=3273387 RepID=UPI00361A42D5
MHNKGILLAMTQVSPDMEDEFNTWYDTEHVQERLAVPGFETASRYVSDSAWPRYLAIYDVERADVLQSETYARVSGPNNSPWTKRILSRAHVLRLVADQIYPGQELLQPSPDVLVLRFRAVPADADAAIVEGLKTSFADKAGVRQIRVFADAESTGPARDVVGVIGTVGPVFDKLNLPAFGPWADALDLANAYRACNRHAA